MRRLSQSALRATLPPENSDTWRERPLGLITIIVVLTIITIFYSYLSYGTLIMAVNSQHPTMLIAYLLINTAGLITAGATLKEHPTQRQQLVIGPAGFYASQVVNLESYVEYKDLFVDWHELRGILLEHDSRGNSVQLRFYVEENNRLAQHRILLQPFVGQWGQYTRVHPIIQSIRRHTGFGILFSCPGQQDTHVLPPPGAKIPLPWQCIFKSAPGPKRTWAFK